MKKQRFTSNDAENRAELKKSHNVEYPQKNKHERSEVFVFTGYDNDKIRECVSTATAEPLDFGVIRMNGQSDNGLPIFRGKTKELLICT